MQLQQKTGLLGGKLTITVDEQDVLSIEHKKFMNTIQNQFLLDNIDPQYGLFKGFSLASAVFAAISLIASIILLWYGKTYHSPPDDGAYLFFSILLFGAFLIAGVKAMKSRRNIIYFNSVDGERLFNILGNKPNPQKVHEFCNNLKNRIESIRYRGEISVERMQEILTRHVEFLYKHKVLNDAELNSALNRIKDKSKINVVDFGQS